MKSIIKKIGAGMTIAALGAVMLVGGVATVPAYAANGNCNEKNGLSGALDAGCSKGEGQADNLTGDSGIITTVINTMLFIVGILSVIMIIFAGIRYVTAHGDKGQVEGAKNTLIYAIVGLIVAIVAYALVNWVSGLFMTKGN